MVTSAWPYTTNCFSSPDLQVRVKREDWGERYESGLARLAREYPGGVEVGVGVAEGEIPPNLETERRGSSECIIVLVCVCIE